MASELFVLTLASFLHTVFHVITTQYYKGRKQYVCREISKLVSLNKHIWTLIGEYSVVRVLNSFEGDPIRSWRALACRCKVNFNMEDGGGCFLYILRTASFQECPTLRTKIEGAPLLRCRRVSAKETSIPLTECDQTLHNFWCIV